jgi:hypothetical protein
VYLLASIVNSKISKQWFCERYAVKALIVHGGGAIFDNTSCNVGRRGQYGLVGIDRLKGLDGRKSPEDMKPLSSASQSESTDEQFFSMIFSSVVPEADVGYYAFGTESSKLGNVYAEAQNVAKG